jgi:hypothetical protein
MMLRMRMNKTVGNLDDCQAPWQCEMRCAMMLQMEIRRLGDDYGNARYRDLD